MLHLLQKTKWRSALLIASLLVAGGYWLTAGAGDHPEEQGTARISKEGYTRSRSVKGITYSVRYLPPRYLIDRELASVASPSPSLRDSLAQSYGQTLTFIMSIRGPAADSGHADVLLSSSRSQADYAARVSELSFNIERKIFVKTAYGDIHPALTHFEPVTGVANESRLIIVFPRQSGDHDITDGESLDIVFIDEMFGTGINHFIFDSALLRRASGVSTT